MDFFSQSHTANDLAPTQSVPSPRSTPVNNENSGNFSRIVYQIARIVVMYCEAVMTCYCDALLDEGRIDGR